MEDFASEMAAAREAPEERLRALLSELAELGFCLPGSLSERKLRCGNPRCRCRADPPKLHGPYTYWTRKVDGRSVAQLLTAEQAERYRPWIENDRRLRALVRELEAVAVEVAEQAEGWAGKPRPGGGKRRAR